jgi:hypothetical protein
VIEIRKYLSMIYPLLTNFFFISKGEVDQFLAFLYMNKKNA